VKARGVTVEVVGFSRTDLDAAMAPEITVRLARIRDRRR